MKLPSREWLIAQVKKKFWLRLTWWCLVLIAGLIGCEKIKEGYFFNKADMTNPYSHELYVLILAIIGIVSAIISIVSAYISKKKEVSKDGLKEVAS